MDQEKMSPGQAALLEEILKDCETTTRLTAWESNFIDELRGRFIQYGAATKISEKQWGIVRRIEKKIYA